MITKEDNELIQIKKRGNRKKSTHIIGGWETEKKMKSLCVIRPPH